MATRMQAESMEERILHSADVAPLALASATVVDTVTQSVAAVAAVPDAALQRSEIVFVDATLPDAGSLIADLQSQRSAGRPIEIVTIDAAQDGIDVISATLAQRADITAVHVLAHGSDGQMQLGTASLDAQALMQRAGEIASWSASLTADADLLLYGCDLAQTTDGQQLVRDIAMLTGADVAASTDLTGAAQQGGNWTLEYQTGSIESAVAPSLAEQARWQGVLATYTVTTTADTLIGLLPLSGTLRWAISQSNSHAGTDTIVFAVNGTFAGNTLTTGDDNNSAGDFDITDSVNIVGNGTGRTIIDGAGRDRVLDVRSGTVTISGVTVQDGKSNVGAGIRVAGAADLTLTDVIVQDNVGSGGTKGAGIYAAGNLTLRNVTVKGNGISGSAEGAGIYMDANSMLDAKNVEIRDNVAGIGADGGGLYIKDHVDATLENVTFANNTAKRGGGLWNHSVGTTIVNSTVSGNTGSSEGGGIWTDAALSLDHVTVAYNSSALGGGVADKSSGLSVSNSLFASNTGGNTNRALISLGYNLSTDASAGFTATGDMSNVAAGLLSLASNGGYTRTHAIGAASAAVDAANPTTTLATDQRGIAYVVRADIGAYEYNLGNYAPTVTTIADQSINEDGTLAPTTFTIGDVETAPGSLVVTATSDNQALLPNASIVLGGSGANRTISLAPVANANSSANGGPATVRISVSDGVNTTLTTFKLTVMAVNDAPTLTMPAAVTTNEDSSLVLSGVNAPVIGDVDVPGSSIQVTLSVSNGLLSLSGTTGLSFIIGNGSGNASMTFSGSVSAVDAALNGLCYTPTADYNGTARLDLSVNDLGNGGGAALTASGATTITVASVNDAPTLGLPGPQVTQQPAPLSFSAANGNAITLADVDAGSAQMELTLTTSNVGNGTLSFGSIAGLSFVSGTGTNDTSIVVRGSQSALTAALDTLSFLATSGGSARIDMSASDLGGSGSGGTLLASGSVTITVSNDQAPVVTLSRSTATYTENDASTALDPGLVISDGDTSTLASAAIRISGGHVAAEDALSFTSDSATMGNITGSYSGGELTLTSSGQTATLAQWQAALRSVSYINSSEAPSAAARTVTIAVNDGIADSAVRALTIAVLPLNDAPVLSGSSAMPTIFEGASGNAGAPVSTLIAGYITDVDASAQTGMAVIGVDDTNGTWQYTTDGGSTWSDFGVVSDSSARLLGSDAGTAVRFVPNADWNGTLTQGLMWRAWDQSTGVAGGVADASVNGGTAAFSAATAGSDVTVTPVNDAPVQATSVPAQTAVQGTHFDFTLPGGVFTDVDAGDTMTYSAGSASGGPLPRWLSFDSATRTFSGTPGNSDVGRVTIRVTATDGAQASAFADFFIDTANINDAPVAESSIADQAATQDAAFSFAIPEDTFTDIDAGDTLTYEATLSSGAALPSWLSFDASTQTFTGTPANADVGALTVRVSAIDASSARAQADFTLAVANVNDAPQVVATLANQAATEGTPFRFDLPSPAFDDVDVGDTLAYTATLADGSALPTWLSFDANALKLTGSPNASDAGRVDLLVRATDASGASAVAPLTITVTALPVAPPVIYPPAPPPPVVAAPAPAPAPTPVAEAPAPAPAPTPVVEAPATPPAPAPAPTPAPAPASPPAIPVQVPISSAAETTQVQAASGSPVVPAEPSTAAPPSSGAAISGPAPEAPGRVDTTFFAQDSAAVATPAAVPQAQLLQVSLPNITRPYVRAEAALDVAAPPQFGDISSTPLTLLLHSEELTRKFEELQRHVLDRGEQHDTLVMSSAALTGGMSIGYVVWLVRGGVLVSSMLSALPAWQMVDPLPVLAAAGSGRSGRKTEQQGEDGEVERLFEEKKAGGKAGKPHKADARPAAGHAYTTATPEKQQ